MTNGVGGLHDEDKNKSQLRINEGKDAVEKLGYDREQVIDGTMPFYLDSERRTSKADVDKMSKLIKNINPQHIFVCCDPDPNGTHTKCLNIMKSIPVENMTRVKHIWLYKSAWATWNGNETDEFYFGDHVMEQKRSAILAHKSQHILAVNNGDIKSLDDIIKNFKKSPIVYNCYFERFRRETLSQFYEDGLLDMQL